MKPKTPFVKEDDYENTARDPATKGNGLVCPWCEGAFPKDDFAPYGGKKAKSGAHGSARKPPPEPRPPGKLAPIAAKIIMKVFYAARVARFDLLRAVGFLACYITRWDELCDEHLHALMCYIKST